MNTTPTTTATGARSDQYAIDAREAYQALSDAVLSATEPLFVRANVQHPFG